MYELPEMLTMIQVIQMSKLVNDDGIYSFLWKSYESIGK